MHSVFNLISIILINLLIINRSSALSFTNNLNPFYRSQSTSIENASIISNTDTYSNFRPNIQQSAEHQNQNNPNLNDNRSRWPNIRFMRTFLRGAPVNAGNQMNLANPKYILGYNPPNDQTVKQLTKLPEQHKISTDENEPQNAGLIDWNKILTKLNQATGFRNTSTSLPTSRATKRPIERSSEYYPSDDKKEEEKESNNGLINYFSTFFSSNENETINAEKEKQLAKQKVTAIESKPISIDLFYFNDNLLAKKQIEVLVCDKTMAIVNVRKNRFGTNRTIQNCVLFDLEKRGKEAEDIVKKLKINKFDIDFLTMMNVINQCRPFSDPANKIEAIENENEYDVGPIKKAIGPGNGLKVANLTVGTNLNIQTDNKSTLNLMTGIVSGTLWCGLGDLAKNYTDLGPRKDLDICCRAHDHCPIRLRALRYGYGLLNFGISTKSHCQCDRDFFKCLKDVNTKLSNTIGNVYFNVLKLQCIEEGPTCVEFDEKNPMKECIRKKNLMQFKTSELF